MNKLLLFLLLSAAPARAQFSNSYIINTPTAQDAQFNVGTGTVRGTLTAGKLITSNLTVGALTVTSITGGGAGLNNLPAAQLVGTISSGVVTGAYPGITGVGTLASGIWHGTPVGVQYGGTGQNFVNISTGDLVYFNATGVMAGLTPGSAAQLLQSNGFAAPSWTGSPQVNGQFIQNIQPIYFATGTIPSYVKIDDASILAVSGSKVAGNISGNAAGISGFLPLFKLSSGTLSPNIVASSITGTGVAPGVYGSSNIAVQITVGSDGRLRTAQGLSIPGVGPNTAKTDIDNGFTATQTILLSSLTVGGNALVQGTMTATYIIGDCGGCTNINGANITGIIIGTGTANQFAYFTGQKVIASTGAFTINGTTLRIGNLNAPLPTNDVHLLTGNGARAYNINLSENPVYLEVSAAAGAFSQIGFSRSGNQHVRIAETQTGNFIMQDDQVGGGLGIFLKESGGVGNVTIGNPQIGESGIATPTTLAIYGVLTSFGTAATQPISSLSNGTFYFNSGPNHYQFSENNGSYVTLPGLAATGFAGAIPYFTINNGTYLSNDISFTTNTILAKFYEAGVSTSALSARVDAHDITLAAIAVSTADLQSQVNTIVVSTANVQAQFNSIAISTAAIGFSTGTLKAQVFGLFISTGQLEAADAVLSASTVSLQAQINSIVVSTTNVQVQLNAVAISTAGLQTQIDALNISTAALAAVDLVIAASTADLRIGLNNVAASTATIATSTGVLQAQIFGLFISTGINQAHINALDASTAALHAIDLAVGTSTNNLQIGLNNMAIATATIAVSTGVLQAQIYLVGTATAAIAISLNNVAVATAAIATSTGVLQAQISAVSATTSTFIVRTGDTMTGDFTVSIATIYANGGSVAVASATANPTSFLIFGKASDNSSFLTNSNTSGVLHFMRGKANPQIMMGNSATTGTAFIDASSGRPFSLQSLSTGVLTLGGSANTSVVISPSIFSVGGNLLTVSGGNIGIGTSAPEALIHASSGTSFAFHYFGSSITLEANFNPGFQTRRFTGAIASPSAIADGLVIGAYAAAGFDGTGYPTAASVSMVSSGTYSSTSRGSFINLNTTLLGDTTLNTRMRITDSGRVGIGTTTPSSLLHIAGANTLVTSDSGILRIESTDAFAIDKGGALVFSGATGAARPNIELAGISGRKENATESNDRGYLQFVTNGVGAIAERMRLDSNGFLGIGTSSPSSKLHLSGGVLTVDGASAGATFGTTAPVTFSSAAFMGVTYSTQASSGVGAATTATCPAGRFADYGGCDCSGITAATSIINRPNSVTAGVLPTGHTCQVIGTVGGACAAFAHCSVIQ